MKATVNGVSVEGTPQEIAEYVRLVNTQSYTIKMPDVRVTKDAGKVPYKPDIYCGGVAPMSTF